MRDMTQLLCQISRGMKIVATHDGVRFEVWAKPRAKRSRIIGERGDAVEIRAEKDFPTDDSGNGFDNIGDVLTISPVLMEKYISAAERIAARAIGADPLPKPVAA